MYQVVKVKRIPVRVGGAMTIFFFLSSKKTAVPQIYIFHRFCTLTPSEKSKVFPYTRLAESVVDVGGPPCLGLVSRKCFIRHSDQFYWTAAGFGGQGKVFQANATEPGNRTLWFTVAMNQHQG